MGEDDMAATLCSIARAGEADDISAVALHFIHEQLRQRSGFGLKLGHRYPIERRQTRLQRRDAQDRWRPGAKAGDAFGRTISSVEGEGIGVSHPPWQGRGQPILQMVSDEQEGGRAGAAVQIFIAASHRQVAAVAAQIDGERTSAVRQVPQTQHAHAMRDRVDRLHVMLAAAAVIDLGQHEDGDAFVDCALDFAGRDRLDGDARNQCLQPLSDIKVGWEIPFLRQDDPPLAAHQRSAEQLEQVDRSRIADQQLIRGRSHRRR